MENQKNKETSGGNMRAKEKIIDYFHQYWGTKVFMKSISLFVALCFLINIANLPAFAQNKNDDELLTKQIKIIDKQEAVANPAVVKPVSEQVSVTNIKTDLSKAAMKELDRKDMAVTAVGAILEKSRDGKKENVVGSIDEKGKPHIFSGDSSRPFNKSTEEDYTYRAQQVLDSGAKKGQFVPTHSKEYLGMERSRQSQERTEEAESGNKAVKSGEKVKEEEVTEAGIKDKNVEQSVQKERKEVGRKQSNEESAESKQNAIKELVKVKDTTSVTKATIAKVQESGEKAGVTLVAEKNNEQEKTKIELYTSKYNGEGVFVGISEGQMAYPTHNGSVEVKEAKDKINIGGNEFEATGVSLSRGVPEQQDNTINRNAEGLFFAEMLGIFDSTISDEQMSKIRESLAEAETNAPAVSIYAVSVNLSKSINAMNKGVLALQSLVSEVATGVFQSEVKKTKKEKSIEESEMYQDVVKKMMEDTGQSEADVKKALEGVSEEQLSVLNDLYKDENASIMNCATDSLLNMLESGLDPVNGISKGLLALQALAVDIASGVFGADSIKDGQLNTSMNAMNKVLNSYGKESAGYGVSLDDFMSGLKDGESGILWVNENHFITVTKNGDDFDVSDSNVNDGKAVTYTAEGFKKAMTGGEAVDKNGNKVTNVNGEAVKYNAAGKDGKVKVLTDSKGVAQQKSAEKLSVSDMKSIKGAMMVSETYTAIENYSTTVSYQAAVMKTGYKTVYSRVSGPFGLFGAIISKLVSSIVSYVYKTFVTKFKTVMRTRQVKKKRMVYKPDPPKANPLAKTLPANTGKNKGAAAPANAPQAAGKTKQNQNAALQPQAKQQNQGGLLNMAKNWFNNNIVEPAKKVMTDIKQNKDIAVSTIANAYNQWNLNNKQRAAANAATNGTQADQERADKELEAAEQKAINSSNALADAKSRKAETESERGNKDQAEKLNNEAKNIKDDAQTAVLNGRADVAAAKTAGAKAAYNDAVKSGDQAKIDAAKTDYINASAAQGKVLDEALEQMTASGNTSGADAITDKIKDVLNGKQYTGDGETAEQKLRNDAAVTAAIIQSDASSKKVTDAAGSSDPAVKITDADAQKAADDAAAVIAAMNSTGNSDKVKDFETKILAALGNKDTSDKPLTEKIKDSAVEINAKKDLDAAMNNAEENGSAENWAAVGQALDAYTAAANQTGNEDKAEAAVTAALEAIGYTDGSSTNADGSQKPPSQRISEAVTVVETQKALDNQKEAAATETEKNQATIDSPTATPQQKEAARQAIIDANANKGKAYDETIAALNAAGDNAGAENLTNEAARGLQYAGNGKTFEDKMRNNASVTTAIDISDSSRKKVADGINNDTRISDGNAEQAAKDADAVIQAMQEAGVSQEEQDAYRQDVMKDIGNNNTDPNTSLGDNIRNSAAEQNAKKDVDSAQQAADNAKSGTDPEKYDTALADLGKALDDYQAAAAKTGNEDKAEAAVTAALKSIGYTDGAEDRSASDRIAQAKAVVDAKAKSAESMQPVQDALANGDPVSDEAAEQAAQDADEVEQAMKDSGASEQAIKDYRQQVGDDLGNKKVNDDLSVPIGQHVLNSAAQANAANEANQAQQNVDDARQAVEDAREALKDEENSRPHNMERLIQALDQAEKDLKAAYDEFYAASAAYSDAAALTGNEAKATEQALTVAEGRLADASAEYSAGGDDWAQTVQDYIDGKITPEQYAAAKETRDAERAALQTLIDDVNDKSDLYVKQSDGDAEERVTGAATIAAGNATALMNDADQKASDVAEEAVKSAGDEVVGADGDTPQSTPEQQAAYEKYLRALKVAGDTSSAMTDEQKEEIAGTQEKVDAAVQEAAAKAHDTLKTADPASAAYKQALSFLNIVAQSGNPIIKALKALSVGAAQNLIDKFKGLQTQAGLTSQGITVDYDKGKVTQRGLTTDVNGNQVPFTRTMSLSLGIPDEAIGSDAYNMAKQSIDPILKAMADGGFEAGLNAAKVAGLFSKDTMQDATGATVYTAESVGYNPPGNGHGAEVAVQWTFGKGYEDSLYFDNGVPAGEIRIVTESFNANGDVTGAMVYRAEESNADSKYTTESGLVINTKSVTLGTVERVTKITDNEDGSRHAKSVVFDEKNNPAYLVDSTIYKVENGNPVVVANRYNVQGALIDPDAKGDPNAPKPTQAQQDAKKALDPIVDEFADMLGSNSTHSMRIQGEPALYAGFDKVDSEHIDLTKATSERSCSLNNLGWQNAANVSTTERLNFDISDPRVSEMLNSGKFTQEEVLGFLNSTGVSLPVKVTTTAKTSVNGITVPAGAEFDATLTDGGAVQYRTRSELDAEINVPNGWAIDNSDGPQSINVSFTAGSVVNLNTGLNGRNVVNTGTIKWNSTEFDPGDIVLSANGGGFKLAQDLNISVDISNNGTPNPENVVFAADSGVMLLSDGRIFGTDLKVHSDGVELDKPGSGNGGSSYSGGTPAAVDGKVTAGKDGAIVFTGEFLNVNETNSSWSSVISRATVEGANPNSRVTWSDGTTHSSLGTISGGDLEITYNTHGQMTARATARGTIVTAKKDNTAAPNITYGTNIKTFDSTGMLSSQLKVGPGQQMPTNLVGDRTGVNVENGTFILNFEVADGMESLDANGSPIVLSQEIDENFKAVQSITADGKEVVTTFTAAHDEQGNVVGLSESYTVDGVSVHAQSAYIAGTGVVLQTGDNEYSLFNAGDGTIIKGEVSQPAPISISEIIEPGQTASKITFPGSSSNFTMYIGFSTPGAAAANIEAIYSFGSGEDIMYYGRFTTASGLGAVETRLGTYETSSGISVTVTINGDELTAASNETGGPFQGQRDTYKLDNLRDPIIVPSEGSQGASSEAPQELTALPISTTWYDKTTGEKIIIQMSSLSLPEITGRADGQYQVWGSLNVNGTIVQGVNRHTITDGITKASFIGFDSEGNQYSATYSAQSYAAFLEQGNGSNVFTSGAQFILGNESGPVIEHMTVKRFDVDNDTRIGTPTIIGFYDINYDNGAGGHYADEATVQAWSEAAINAVRDPGQKPASLEGADLDGSVEYNDDYRVDDFTIGPDGQVIASVSVKTAYTNTDYPDLGEGNANGDGNFVGRSTFNVTNLDGVSEDMPEAFVISESFRGFDNMGNGFTYDMSAGKRDNGGYGAILNEAYFTSQDGLIRQAASGSKINIAGGTASRVETTLDEQGRKKEEKLKDFTTDETGNIGDATIEYTYGITKDITEEMLRDSGLTLEDLKNTTLVVNIATVTATGYESETWTDTRSGEVCYNHTKYTIPDTVAHAGDTTETTTITVYTAESGSDNYTKEVVTTSITTPKYGDESTSISRDSYGYNKDGTLVSYQHYEWVDGKNSHLDLKTDVAFDEITGEIKAGADGAILIDGKTYATENHENSDNGYGDCDAGISLSKLNDIFAGYGLTAAAYFNGGSTLTSVEKDGKLQLEFTFHLSDGSILTEYHNAASNRYTYAASNSTYGYGGYVGSVEYTNDLSFDSSWSINAINYITAKGNIASMESLGMKYDINTHSYVTDTDTSEGLSTERRVYDSYDPVEQTWTGYGVDDKGVRQYNTSYSLKVEGNGNKATETIAVIVKNDDGSITTAERSVNIENGNRTEGDKVETTVNTDGTETVKKYHASGNEFSWWDYNKATVIGAVVGTLAVIGAAALAIVTFGAAIPVLISVAIAAAIALPSVIMSTIDCVDAIMVGDSARAWKSGIFAFLGVLSVFTAGIGAGGAAAASVGQTAVKVAATQVIKQAAKALGRAAIGAAIGAGVGAIVGGVVSVANGNSFFGEAFLEGLTIGALAGAAIGLATFAKPAIGTIRSALAKSAGEVATKQLITKVALNKAKEIVIRTVLSSGGGALAGGLIGGFISSANGGSFAEGFAIGAVAGAFIGANFGISAGAVGGFKNLFGAGRGALGTIFKTAGVVLGKSIDAVITINASRSFVDSTNRGDTKGAFFAMWMLFTINVANPMSQFNERSESVATLAQTSDRMKAAIPGFASTMGKGLKFSAPALLKSLSLGAGGALLGYGAGVIINTVAGEEIVNPWITAGAGALFGMGLGNALNTGQYSNIRSEIVSKIPRTIATTATRAMEMISRIAVFNMRVQSVIAMFQNVTGISIADNSLLETIDNWIGLDFAGAKQLTSSEGSFFIFDISGTNSSLQKSAAMYQDVRMWGFSGITAIAQPILSPILLSMPGLGHAMSFLNHFKGRFKSDTLETLYEEGFTENIAGSLGQFVFGNSQAGEIFQELFDKTPDANMNADFLASANTSVKTNSESVRKTARAIIANSAQQASARTAPSVITALSSVGIDAASLSHDNPIFTATTRSEAESAVLAQIVVQDGVSRGTVKADQADRIVKELSGVDTSRRTGAGLTDTAKFNYLSGLSSMSSIIGSSFNPSNISADVLMTVAQTDSGISVLANYASGFKAGTPQYASIVEAVSAVVTEDVSRDDLSDEYMLNAMSILGYLRNFAVIGGDRQLIDASIDTLVEKYNASLSDSIALDSTPAAGTQDDIDLIKSIMSGFVGQSGSIDEAIYVFETLADRMANSSDNAEQKALQSAKVYFANVVDLSIAETILEQNAAVFSAARHEYLQAARANQLKDTSGTEFIEFDLNRNKGILSGGVDYQTLSVFQFRQSMNQLYNADGTLKTKNVSSELADQLKQASLDMQIGSNLSNGFGLTAKQFEAINGIYDNVIKKLVSGQKLTKEDMQSINILGTGEGKTTIAAVLFPVLKLANDMRGKRTVIAADIDTNVNNLMARIKGLYGNQYGYVKADKDNLSSARATDALFMTYTDYAFATLGDESFAENTGTILGDEADMAVYLSKVMISNSGGFENMDSQMAQFFMEFTKSGSAYNEALSNAIKNIYAELSSDPYFAEIKAKYDRFASKQLTDADVQEMKSSLESLKVEIAAKVTDEKVRDVMVGNIDTVMRQINSGKGEMIDLMVKAAETALKARTDLLLQGGNTEFNKVLADFVDAVKSGIGENNIKNLYRTDFELKEVLNNMLMAKLTWVRGVNYDIAQDQEGNTKVQLITNGVIADLVPGVGFKQIIEAEILAEQASKDYAGEKIDGMTAVGDKKHSSTAIINALQAAGGFIGLTGTYSSSARSAMGFSAVEYTDPTAVNLTGSESHINKNASDERQVQITTFDLAANVFESFTKPIVSLLQGGTTVIMGMPSQSQIDLFKGYLTVLGAIAEKDGITKTLLDQEIAWFDAGMSKEDGQKYAKNEKGRYYHFIGTNEQLGRGIDIQLQAAQNVDKVDLIIKDAHLSYKSAFEQLAGRVLGTRFAAQWDMQWSSEAKENGKPAPGIEISIISDVESIKTYSRDHESKMVNEDGTIKTDAQDYVQLINDRVYGQNREGREAEDRVVAQSGANAEREYSEARPYFANKASMDNALRAAGFGDTAIDKLAKVLFDKSYCNESNMELTSKGSVAMGYVIQLLGYDEQGNQILSEEKVKKNIEKINEILGEDSQYDEAGFEANIEMAVNLVSSLQEEGMLTDKFSGGLALNDIFRIKTLYDISGTDKSFKDIAADYIKSGLGQDLLGKKLYDALEKLNGAAAAKKELKDKAETMYEEGQFEGVKGKIKQYMVGVKNYFVDRTYKKAVEKFENQKFAYVENNFDSLDLQDIIFVSSLRRNNAGNIVFGEPKITEKYKDIYNKKKATVMDAELQPVHGQTEAVQETHSVPIPQPSATHASGNVSAVAADGLTMHDPTGMPVTQHNDVAQEESNAGEITSSQQDTPASLPAESSSRPASTYEIPTPQGVINQLGMPAIIEGVQGILGINSMFGLLSMAEKENSIESILNGCTAEALMVMGKGNAEELSRFIAEAVRNDAEITETGTAGMLLAAGKAEGSRAVRLGALAKAGRYEYAVMADEADMNSLYVPKSGIAAYMEGKEKAAGHLVVIKSVEDGKVSYVDSGESMESSISEFKDMGFSGIMMMSRSAKRTNQKKGSVSSLNANMESVKKFFELEDGKKYGNNYWSKGARKLGDLVINGVTEGGELNKAVLYVLNIWKNTEEMASALDVTMEDVRDREKTEDGSGVTVGVKKITHGYYMKVSEVLGAGKEGILSPGEVMAEVKLLSTVRDMLIGVNTGEDGRLEELLNKEKLEEEEVSEVMNSLIVSKAVKHSVMIEGMKSAKEEVKKENKDEVISVERLKMALEEKKSVKEKFIGRFFARDAKLEDVLPNLGSDMFVDIRGTMQSPMMARALAAAA